VFDTQESAAPNYTFPPFNGEAVSWEADHDWTEQFELANGLITKFDVKLFFNQPLRS
jgi:hypothetical protein